MRTLAFLAALLPINAGASILYESADGLTAFSPSSGWLIQDYRPTWEDATQFPAMPFYLSAGGEVTGAELALTALADWSGNYTVEILNDAGGKPGTEVVWRASTLERAPIFEKLQSYSFSAASGVAATLDSNTRYWLALSCTAKCSLSWWASANNITPGAIQHTRVYPYELLWTVIEDKSAMFRIIGNVPSVPEPAQLVMLLTGLAVLGIPRRKALP